jgi:plastocyanin
MYAGNGALVIGLCKNAHTMPRDIEPDTLEVSAGTAVSFTPDGSQIMNKALIHSPVGVTPEVETSTAR